MEYKVIGVDGKIKRTEWRREPETYKSRRELLLHIKGCYSKDFRLGVDGLIRDNTFLNGCCHHWGETYKVWDHKFNPDTGHYIYKAHTYLRSSMIVDEYGRKANIPDLAKEAWAIKLPEKSKYYPRYSYMDDGTEWWEDSWWWTLHVKRSKRNAYLGYNGRSKKHLQQERKIACDPMHKPYVRGKRTPMMLDTWGMAESRTKAQITWKQMKIKKQWMEKL